jgi:hypothetical protein
MDQEMGLYLSEMVGSALDTFELACTFYSDRANPTRRQLEDVVIYADVAVTIFLAHSNPRFVDDIRQEKIDKMITGFFETTSLEKLRQAMKMLGLQVTSLSELLSTSLSTAPSTRPANFTSASPSITPNLTSASALPTSLPIVTSIRPSGVTTSSPSITPNQLNKQNSVSARPSSLPTTPSNNPSTVASSSPSIALNQLDAQDSSETPATAGNTFSRSLLVGALSGGLLLIGLATAARFRKRRYTIEQEENSQAAVYLESEHFVSKPVPKRIAIVSYEKAKLYQQALLDAPSSDAKPKRDVGFKMMDGPDLLASTTDMDQRMDLWDDSHSLADSTICVRNSFLDDRPRPEYRSKQLGHKFRPWEENADPRKPAKQSRLLRPFVPVMKDHDQNGDESVASGNSMQPQVPQSRKNKTPKTPLKQLEPDVAIEGI